MTHRNKHAQGPVLVSQMFGIADVCLQHLTSTCMWWIIISSLGLFLIISFIACGVYRLRASMREGEMTWIKSQALGFSDIKHQEKSTTGMGRGVLACFQMGYMLRFAGDWKKDSTHAKFWGFLVGNVGESLWPFFAFKLLFKCYAALVVNFAAGTTGGMLVSGFLAVEGIIVMLKAPHRDNWQNIMQPLSVLCNMLSCLGLTLSVMLPSVQWLEGPYIMYLLSAATALQLLILWYDSFISKIILALGNLAPVLCGLGTSMKTRFKRIALTRSAKQASAVLKEEQEEEGAKKLSEARKAQGGKEAIEREMDETEPPILAYNATLRAHARAGLMGPAELVYADWKGMRVAPFGVYSIDHWIEQAD